MYELNSREKTENNKRTNNNNINTAKALANPTFSTFQKENSNIV